MNTAKKILIIDDDIDLRQSFEVTLESQGFMVYSSPNGEEGYDLLLTEKPDLLVLDVMMRTSLEGYNLLHKIKQEEQFKNMPVILLTGMADQLGVNLASGVDDTKLLPHVYFQDKPIDPLKLVKMITDLI